MARVASVSMLRGESQAKGTHPAAGTKLRLVYDMLYEYRGRKMPDDELKALRELAGRATNSPRYGDKYKSLHSLICNLELYYGCDIRGGVLVGEWFGRVYVDYTAPAEDESRRIDADEAVPRELRDLVRDALLGCRPGGTSASLELVV